MKITERYLAKLGIQKRPDPTLETLEQLHKLHTHNFPFENITPFLHEEVSLNDEDLAEKFLSSRGGYCFEHNTLLGTVLKDLGYNVTGLSGRVLWNQPENTITRRSHMLLLIALPEGQFIADVGFGGLTLTSPLLFETDIVQKTTHEDFRIEKLNESFKLQARIGDNWKTLYRFDLIEHFPIDYEVVNFYLSTHPESLFRNNLIAALANEKGRFALNNKVFTFYPKTGEMERRELSSPTEVIKVLEEVFAIKVPFKDKLKKRIETLFDM